MSLSYTMLYNGYTNGVMIYVNPNNEDNRPRIKYHFDYWKINLDLYDKILPYSWGSTHFEANAANTAIIAFSNIPITVTIESWLIKLVNKLIWNKVGEIIND